MKPITPLALLAAAAVTLPAFSQVFPDFDGDGDVDALEWYRLDKNHSGPIDVGLTFEEGDVDGDGDVDNADRQYILAELTGMQNPTPVPGPVELIYRAEFGSLRVDTKGGPFDGYEIQFDQLDPEFSSILPSESIAFDVDFGSLWIEVNGITPSAGVLSFGQALPEQLSASEFMDGIASSQYSAGDGTFDESFTLVYEQIPGDTDSDGDVDNTDLMRAIANFTGPVQELGGKDFTTGDNSGDGDVDGQDLQTAIANFTGPKPPQAPVTVPEPASLLVLAFGGALMVGRHRRG